jgi:hypothetical protein
MATLSYLGASPLPATLPLSLYSLPLTSMAKGYSPPNKVLFILCFYSQPTFSDAPPEHVALLHIVVPLGHIFMSS